MSTDPTVYTAPSRDDCLALMETHGMLPQIKDHSLMVAQVAIWLGERLAQAGIVLDLALIEAGALLHDLGKTACLGTGENHAECGLSLLVALGLTDVGQIVREHVLLNPSRLPAPLCEVQVVHYADKRVLHTRVVTLAERFADLRVRYGKTDEALARLATLEERTISLEEKLFAPLAAHPQDLLSLNNCRREP